MASGQNPCRRAVSSMPALVNIFCKEQPRAKSALSRTLEAHIKNDNRRPVWWGLSGRFTLCEDSVLAHPGRAARTNVNVLFHWKSLWIIQSLFFFTWKATNFCIHMCKRWLSLGHRTTQWQFLCVFSLRSLDGVISQRSVPLIADNPASFLVSLMTPLHSYGKRRQRMTSFTYVNWKWF